MRKKAPIYCHRILVGLFVVVFGCAKSSETSKSLTLATTTSARDTGLLDVLLPVFQMKTGIKVKVIAVGSGQALEIGRRGDADLLMTHSPDAEKAFIAEGHGDKRHALMHNDFILVGPENDPAKIKETKSILEAFAQLEKMKVPFISRGDESGTHAKERKIWKELKINPSGEWYVQAGIGMAETLRMAEEKRAHTLTDRGTYLRFRSQLSLVILSEGDALLWNPYSVICVSSKSHPQVNEAAAQELVKFLLSAETQKLIGEFGVSEVGQPLFIPDAIPLR